MAAQLLLTPQKAKTESGVAMKLLKNLLLSFLLLLIPLFTVSVRSDVNECVYTVYVRTGSIIKGGTDSTISLRLYDEYGEVVDVADLEAWGGLMPAGHNYFERGNLDIFSARGRCLAAPICAMNLTSDGLGPHHGWYCNYVEVTSTGPHVPCSQQTFTVEQWLALNTAPYKLTAIRNYCPDGGVGKGAGLVEIGPSSGSAAGRLRVSV